MTSNREHAMFLVSICASIDTSPDLEWLHVEALLMVHRVLTPWFLGYCRIFPISHFSCFSFL